MFSEDLFKEQTGEDFTSFYEEYNPKLLYYINNICKDTQLAQDIATESYLAAFNNILSYDREKAKFSTWLFTIARNNTYNELKHNKKVSYVEIMDIEQEEIEEESFVDEKAYIIMNGINTLPHPYNIVMDMILVKKSTYDDVSVEFSTDGIPKNINTIKSWVRKGKSLLKDLLEIEFNKIKNKNKNECSKRT